MHRTEIMALELRQQLKLSQQLVMTPQLQQAIKLLQLSRMELVDLVQEELEENPVLEEGADLVKEKELKEETPEGAEGEPASEQIDEIKGEGEGLSDIDWQTYLEGYNLGGAGSDYYDEDDERPSFENLLTKKGTLTDHLLWQLGLSTLEREDRRIAEEIIGNLDENGYLKSSAEEIAQCTGGSAERIEAVLEIVQDFDPAGVACRNLQECLLKQVEYLEMDLTLDVLVILVKWI